VSLGTVVDLVGHGAEERLESILRWLPTRLRIQIAVSATVAGAALALLMLIGEMVGAHYRPPVEEMDSHNPYFLSGPFLTIGVGLYLAFVTAALLVVCGRSGVSRLLLLAAVADAAWMSWAAGYPTPRPLVLALFGGLGLLATLATIRPNRALARGMVRYGTGLVAASALGVLVTRPVLDWSIGTMATSGNVALAVLAVVLPFLGGSAMLIAVLRSRQPGWSAAIAVAALPIVIFCTMVGQAVNPAHAGDRAFYPLYYVLTVTAVALVHRRRHRRPLPVS
jgi:hypothetical protein